MPRRKRPNPVEIRPVAPVKSELRPYVQLGIDLYTGNKYFVPPLVFDEINTLTPSKNPASEFCISQSFMAYMKDEPVGRITGIINYDANRRTGEKICRFGFFDFYDNPLIADALIKAVCVWGKHYGMERLVGPMGFSDLDREGMLIDGFTEMGTMATIYNYPYYPNHLARMGFVKEVDWVEYRIKVPEKVPEKYQRIADMVQRRYNLHTVTMTSRAKLKERYGKAIFRLINESYANLYGFVPLTQKQIDYYIDMYLGILRLDDICLIADEFDDLIGVGITMPSLSKALRGCGGKLFPTGWLRILNAIRGRNSVVDLLLVAIRPDYQGKGVNALLFSKLIPSFIKHGYKYAESNVELEDNSNVQKQWEYFEHRQHRRRRAFTIDIKKILNRKRKDYE